MWTFLGNGTAFGTTCQNWPAGTLPAVQQIAATAAAGQLDMPRDKSAQLAAACLGSLSRSIAYQVAVDPLRKLFLGIPDVGASAGHAGAEVSPGPAEHDDQAAGHVFAAMVAHAFDDRRRAAVADREALAGLAAANSEPPVAP